MDLTSDPNITPAAPHAPLDAQGHIAVDAACLGCRYNLRGLDPKNAACPECGRAIADSFDLRQLRFAPSAQVRSLSKLVSWLFVIGAISPFFAGFALLVAPPISLVIPAIALFLPTIPLWHFLPKDADRAGFPLHDERAIASALADVLWWRLATLILLVASILATILVFSALSTMYAATLSLIVLLSLAFSLCMTAAATLDLFTELARRIPAHPTSYWITRAATVTRVFAYGACGSLVLSHAWQTHGEDCLGLLSTLFGVGMLFFAGPIMIFFVVLARVLFKRRLEELRPR